MASLKDATQVTSEVNDLVQQLNQELTEGDGDFARLTELADAVSERSDKLASAFAAMDQALMQRLSGDGSSEQEQ